MFSGCCSNSTLATDLEDYNPGNKYWDILALDMYSSDGTNYTNAKYDACLKAAAGKPIAIGECQMLPTSAELKVTLDEMPGWFPDKQK